jgi:hypothetical protein
VLEIGVLSMLNTPVLVVSVRGVVAALKVVVALTMGVEED